MAQNHTIKTGRRYNLLVGINIHSTGEAIPIGILRSFFISQMRTLTTGIDIQRTVTGERRHPISIARQIYIESRPFGHSHRGAYRYIIIGAVVETSIERSSFGKQRCTEDVPVLNTHTQFPVFEVSPFQKLVIDTYCNRTATLHNKLSSTSQGRLTVGCGECIIQFGIIENDRRGLHSSTYLYRCRGSCCRSQHIIIENDTIARRKGNRCSRGRIIFQSREIGCRRVPYIRNRSRPTNRVGLDR